MTDTGTTPPDNIEAQLAAARSLCALVREGGKDHPSQDAAELAIDTTMNAIRRVLFAGLDDLTDTQQRMEAAAHIVGFLGEVIGQTVQALPPSVQIAAMTMFAQEMNAAAGLGRVELITPQPKENLH